MAHTYIHKYFPTPLLQVIAFRKYSLQRKNIKQMVQNKYMRIVINFNYKII